MRIFQCTDSFIPVVDGVGRVVKAYAENLAARNNEVYVVTPSDDTGYRGILPYEILDYTSMKISRKLPYKVGLEHIDLHFSERLKFIQPDIVHVHTPAPAGMLGKSIARRKHVPIIGSFHSKYYDDLLKITHSKLIAKAGSNVVADFYRKCDEVWTVSENAGETLRSYGYKGDIIIMPNGTERRVLKSELVDVVATRFGIKQNRDVFLFVGQINWKKNIKRILKGCALLKQGGSDFQLVFAGQGPDEAEIKKFAYKSGLKDNLIMTGHIEDVSVLDCLYHLATLFLFPSVYDNAPMVIREAACMRTPSLVIEGSSSAEVIKDMENGLTCKDTDEDFVSAIKGYLNLSAGRKREIGENAFNSIPIEWNFLMDKIEERYSIVIEKYKQKHIYAVSSRKKKIPSGKKK